LRRSNITLRFWEGYRIHDFSGIVHVVSPAYY
jgi:hypothetical protein